MVDSAPVPPNPVGRPPLYKTPEDLQAKVEEYFRDCPDKFKRWYEGVGYDVPCITISGLVIFLGFDSRQSFYDYENKPEFSYTIKRARTFIEREYEMALRQPSPTGAIFALKQFGWVDKTEVENTHRYQKMPTIKKNGKPARFNVGTPLQTSEN